MIFFFTRGILAWHKQKVCNCRFTFYCNTGQIHDLQYESTPLKGALSSL